MVHPHSAGVIPAHIATLALWSPKVLKERRLNTALMSQHTELDSRDSQSGKWVDNIDAVDVRLGRLIAQAGQRRMAQNFIIILRVVGP